MSRVRKRASIQPPPARGLWPDIAICLVLLTAIAIAYGQTSKFDFVNYDDPHEVENVHIRDGLSRRGLSWALTSGDYGNWLPVTRVSYLADYQLFGLDPGMFHLTNLVFHGLATLLLFAFFRRLSGSRWRSAFVAAFFALHPLHVESVAWISERKDVLAAFFGFATLLAYVHYARQRSRGRYLAVVVLFCLGLMAKPMLVTLPLVMLLVDFWPLRRIVWWDKAPLLAISAAASWVAYAVQSKAGAVAPWDAVPLAQRLGNAAVSYITYIFELLWPARLAVFYPYEPLPLWQEGAAALALLLVTFLAIRWLHSRPWFAVGWFWYLGTLLPVIGLVQIGAAAHADRYSYLPSIGIGILVAWSAPNTRATIGLMAAACAVWLVLTCFQVRYWQNGVELFQHAIQVTKGNWVAYNNLGAALRNQGEIDAAIGDFQQAVGYRQGYIDALVNLCEAYNSQHRFEDGARSCREALAVNPASAEGHADLGTALGEHGKQLADAQGQFRQTVQLLAGRCQGALRPGNGACAAGKNRRRNRRISRGAAAGTRLSQRGIQFGRRVGELGAPRRSCRPLPGGAPNSSRRCARPAGAGFRFVPIADRALTFQRQLKGAAHWTLRSSIRSARWSCA